MIFLSSEFSNIIHGLIAVIIIGVFYTLWMTTRAYGGMIGTALRLIGFGTVLLSVVMMERMLINFGVITNSTNIQLAQDVLTLLALIFLGTGFRRFTNAAKAP